MGTGTDTRVTSLTPFDDGSGEQLLAGGEFTSAGGLTANGTARWSGSAWSSYVDVSGPLHIVLEFTPEKFIPYDAHESMLAANRG